MTGKSRGYGNQVITCPICQAETPIRDGDVSELTTNDALQTSLNRQKSLLLLKYDDSRPKQCQSCFRGDEIHARCLHKQCQHFLCGICEQAHEEMVVFRDHNVISLKDMTESTKIFPRKCTKHPMYSLSIFCMSCLQVVCMKCSQQEHNQHKVVKISEKSKEYRASLKKRIPKLKQIATQFRKQAAQAEVYQEKLARYKEKAKQMASRAHIAKFMSQLLLESDDMEFMQLYPEVHAAVEDINDSEPGELPCIHTGLTNGSHEEEEEGTMDFRNEHEIELMDVDSDDNVKHDDTNENLLYSTPTNGHQEDGHSSDMFQSFTNENDHERASDEENEESDDDVASDASSDSQVHVPLECQPKRKRQSKKEESDDDVALSDWQLPLKGQPKHRNSKRQSKNEESDGDVASNASSHLQLPSKGQPRHRNSKRRSKKEESDDDVASNVSSHSQLPSIGQPKHRNSKKLMIDDDDDELVQQEQEEEVDDDEEDDDDEWQSDKTSNRSSKSWSSAAKQNDQSSSWDRVGKFGQMGNRLGQFNFARGVAVSPKFNTMAIADHSNNRVDLFTLDGEFKVTLKSSRGKKGKSRRGAFRDAEDVAFNSSGNLFVVDRSKFVQEYSTEGNFLKKFTVLNNETSTKVCSSCIAVGSDDRIYVGDCEPSRSLVSVFKKHGSFICMVKLSVLPMYLDVNIHRQLLITDNTSCDVHMVDLGQQHHMTDTYHVVDNVGNMANVTGVVWDNATEGFFVASQQKKRGKGQVHYYSSNGVYVQTVVETKLNNPMGLALSNDNVLVVADMLSVKLFQKQ